MLVRRWSRRSCGRVVSHSRSDCTPRYPVPALVSWIIRGARGGVSMVVVLLFFFRYLRLKTITVRSDCMTKGRRVRVREVKAQRPSCGIWMLIRSQQG